MKQNYEKYKGKNRGITLIALVITIIVMLILVAVTISLAVNGGLFNYAGMAAEKTQNALDAEQQLANGEIIKNYLSNQSNSGTYDSTEKDEDGTLTENATYIQGEYTATIPKGFKMSDVPAEQTIIGGLVIEDVDGNEFVWIPVKEGTFERTGWWENEPTTDIILEEFIEDFEEEDYKQYIANYRGYDSIDEMVEDLGYSDYEEMLDCEWGGTTLEETIQWFNYYYESFGALTDNYIENVQNDPTGEYANMVASVNKYGGFYIGRYEAGSTTKRTNVANGTTQMVVKRDANPYNYVGWGATMSDCTNNVTDNFGNQGQGAVALSKAMYASKDVGVTSTLCYGIQWDATLRFIKDKVNVTNSIEWGNYKNGLLKTGTSEENKAKNIYNLAGNVGEWTMEVGSSSRRVVRGGTYGYSIGVNRPAMNRYSMSINKCYPDIGFRPALYIK